MQERKKPSESSPPLERRMSVPSNLSYSILLRSTEGEGLNSSLSPRRQLALLAWSLVIVAGLTGLVLMTRG